MENGTNMNKILLISGKRKSGKDYVSEKLIERIGTDKCSILRISEPLKNHFAQKHNLDLHELMSDNKYKENYRLQMILWSDEVRSTDPGYFCRAACNNGDPKLYWIVSDIRRKSDIKWFKETYGDQIRTIRISASEETRTARGYIFTTGIDDGISELDLDDYYDWDLSVTNNNTEEFNKAVQDILNLMDA
ncbi:hypothetical protein FQA39_LY15808 [Lamprigera yunnana]|nr:hypothetical protein FQA39_LY15808 [Lamprigera yunnana]